MDYSLCVCIVYIMLREMDTCIGKEGERWRGKSKDSYRDFRLGLHSCLVGPLDH